MISLAGGWMAPQCEPCESGRINRGTSYESGDRLSPDLPDLYTIRPPYRRQVGSHAGGRAAEDGRHDAAYFAYP